MRRRTRRLAQVVAMLLAAAIAVPAVVYRRQLVSLATHRKGGPSTTQPYEVLPSSPPRLVRLAVAGDVGDGGSRIDRTGDLVASIDARDPFDALWLLGDNVYPDGDPAKLDATVFGPFAAVLGRGAALLAILGNHDVMAGHGDAQAAALGLPGRWWSREIGGVLLVGLDSNTPDDAEQLAWLERTLSTSSATWRIVALHHPPYSAGYQGSSLAARRTFTPLFERYGVQLVLSGHDHDYQRSVPIGGVTYVVSGAGSGTRRTGDDAFTAVSFSWHHVVEVTVTADRLVLRAIGQDGTVADRAVILPTGGEG